MIGQFFGNYLLNTGFISREDFLKAMELRKNTHVKLGLLAIDANYLTVEQVNKLHQKQQTVDMKMGDLAIEMNLLTKEQVTELLQKQANSYLSFAQTLVEQGFLTDAQLNQALFDYKEKYALSDQDFNNQSNESIDKILLDFYHFENDSQSEIYIEYIELLFKNIIRFVGDDFIPLLATEVNEYDMNWQMQQQITGKINLLTCIEASKNSFMRFAERYAGEDFNNSKEYAEDAVGDFLNLHNGLFMVNMSNKNGLELYLQPQVTGTQGIARFEKEIICLPLCFPFGVINILLINKEQVLV